MLPPAMQVAAASRMGAVMATISTCHMSIHEEPKTIAVVIDRASASLQDGVPARSVLSGGL